MIALTLITNPEIFALFHGWNNYNSWIAKFQSTLQLFNRSFKGFSVCMTVHSKEHLSRIFFIHFPTLLKFDIFCKKLSAKVI